MQFSAAIGSIKTVHDRHGCVLCLCFAIDLLSHIFLPLPSSNSSTSSYLIFFLFIIRSFVVFFFLFLWVDSLLSFHSHSAVMSFIGWTWILQTRKYKCKATVTGFRTHSHTWTIRLANTHMPKPEARYSNDVCVCVSAKQVVNGVYW